MAKVVLVNFVQVILRSTDASCIIDICGASLSTVNARNGEGSSPWALRRRTVMDQVCCKAQYHALEDVCWFLQLRWMDLPREKICTERMTCMTAAG